VAKADPKRASAPAAKPVEEKASAAAEEGETQELDPELLDAVLQAEAKTTGTAKKKSGGRGERRKKTRLRELARVLQVPSGMSSHRTASS
jgi:hypothetical protein